MQDFHKFDAQIGSSCTPASIMYAVVLMETNTPAVCSEDAMRIIMENASVLYKRKTTGRLENFLQQCEVLEDLGMYIKYNIRELHASKGVDLTGFPKECIDHDDIWEHLIPRSGMIITCSGHTSCVVEKNGAFHFDPMVASVQPLRNKEELIASILRAHGAGCQEMTINLVLPKNTSFSNL